jgi:hypothetical protein
LYFIFWPLFVFFTLSFDHCLSFVLFLLTIVLSFVLYLLTIVLSFVLFKR